MNLKLTVKAQKFITDEGGCATISLINKVCYT